MTTGLLFGTLYLIVSFFCAVGARDHFIADGLEFAAWFSVALTYGILGLGVLVATFQSWWAGE